MRFSRARILFQLLLIFALAVVKDGSAAPILDRYVVKYSAYVREIDVYAFAPALLSSILVMRIVFQIGTSAQHTG